MANTSPRKGKFTMSTLNINQNKSINDVFTKIMQLDRKDYVSPAQSVTVSDGQINMAGNSYELTDFASEQMNQRWTGFNTFSRSLNNDGHSDLQQDTLNELLSRDDRNIVARTIQPNGNRIARAIVSDHYKPIDDNIILPEILTVIGDNADKWRGLGGQVTETNSYLKFISREPQITLNLEGRNRELFVGFQYSNSEVGRGYSQFSAFFFDSYCENGCVFGKMTVADCKFMHRGSKIETSFGEIFEDRVKALELAQIQGTIIDATRITCQGKFLPEVKNLLESTINRKIDGNDSKYIDIAGKQVGLNERQIEATKIAYDGTRNQFGLQAAITKAAQSEPTYENRQDMELAGGKILSMNDKVWNSIAALA